MKKFSLALLVLTLNYSDSVSQIFINEIMYAPADASNEWFEIYNSGNASVNLQNWKWKDATSAIRTLTTQNINLQTKEYIIICQDTNKLKNQFPDIAGKFIQTVWSTLNNTGDNLILIDAVNARVDSVSYQTSWGGNSGGFSLEKIIPTGPSNNSANWGTSVDLANATPDRQNSLTPKPFDLLLKSFTIEPNFPSSGDTLNFIILIKNKGLNTAENFLLNIYNDLNFDSISQNNETLNSHSFSSLRTDDSLIYNFSFFNSDTGTKQFIAEIIYREDNDTLNNKLIKRIFVNGLSGNNGIRINEIMYAPDSPEPEWIEIYNTTPGSINIKNWKIADSSGQNNPVTITSADRYINSNDYLVIAKNSFIIEKHISLDTNNLIILSSLPILNNDKDKIILFNAGQTIIDQVSYKSSWGGTNGKSLERKSGTVISNDSADWHTSIDCENSTPLRINSIVNASEYSKGALIINEIMYNPLSNQSEWIEFYNPNSLILKLTGWEYRDLSNQYNLTDTCFINLNSGEYFILAKDSTLFENFSYLLTPSFNQKIFFNKNMSLSNDGEPIVILDLFGNIIDSVFYHDSWNNPNLSDSKGISLERINSEFGSNERNNWSSSANPKGGTPGLQNSIFTKNLPSNSTVSINPNPFSPDGDGFEDFAVVKYKLNVAFAQMRIKIFDIKGRMVRELANNEITGSEGTVIFNGFGDDNQRLRIGIYFLLIEAIDDRGGTVSIIKTPLVIAAKL